MIVHTSKHKNAQTANLSMCLPQRWIRNLFLYNFIKSQWTPASDQQV